MCVLVAQSCLTLCNPIDYSPPGSSVCGILQARILEWVAISLSRGSADPGTERRFPALQASSLLSEPPVKPLFPEDKWYHWLEASDSGREDRFRDKGKKECEWEEEKRVARTQSRKEERAKGGSQGSKRGRQWIHKTSSKEVGLTLVRSGGTVWCRGLSRSSVSIVPQVLVPPPHFPTSSPPALLLHCPISLPNKIPRSLTADTLIHFCIHDRLDSGLRVSRYYL